MEIGRSHRTLALTMPMSRRILGKDAYGALDMSTLSTLDLYHSPALEEQAAFGYR
jgi:hypothetical protein